MTYQNPPPGGYAPQGPQQPQYQSTGYGQPQQPQYGQPQGGQGGAPKDGGYIYPNDKKVRAEQPDQKGKIRMGDDIVRRVMAGEREFYISGWNKQDQKGGRFLSLKMKGIDPKPQGGWGQPQGQQQGQFQQQAAWGGQPQPQQPMQPQYQQQPMTGPQQGMPQQAGPGRNPIDDEIPF